MARKVRHACERVGFFYLAGHGVPDDVIATAFEASREFHGMPLEEKLRLKLNENNIYSPNPESTIECLPSCVSAASPARYPRAIYRELVLEFYNANHFHRKEYVPHAGVS